MLNLQKATLLNLIGHIIYYLIMLGQINKKANKLYLFYTKMEYLLINRFKFNY